MPGYLYGHQWSMQHAAVSLAQDWPSQRRFPPSFTDRSVGNDTCHVTSSTIDGSTDATEESNPRAGPKGATCSHDTETALSFSHSAMEHVPPYKAACSMTA